MNYKLNATPNKFTRIRKNKMRWKKQELITILFSLTIIDLLFFPRILFAFGISLAYITIPTILIIGNIKYKSKQLRLIVLMAILLLISAFYGQISIKNTDFSEDIKRVAQLSIFTIFSLLPLTKVDANKENINRIINFFYIYNIILLGLFLFAPSVYTSYMGITYPESLEQIEENLFSYRYSYIFTDPNTFGYMLALLFSSKAIINKLEVSALQILISLTLVISTQSRGALIALFLCLLYLLITNPKLYLQKYLSFGFFLAAVSILIDLNPISVIINLIETRSTLEEAAGLSLGGGRAEKYLYLLSQLSFLPFGSGYTLYHNGEIFRPHSDLIRLVLSYGYLSLFILTYIIIYKFKHRFIIYTPIIIPFLINTLIDDYRLLPLFFTMTTAIINSQTFSKNIRHIPHTPERSIRI